jgi:type II secretory pathway component GspD/PulD (secretin)
MYLTRACSVVVLSLLAIPTSAQQPDTSQPNVVDSLPSTHKVTLNFREQEWLSVLKWLANELQLNLDWQTLPEGHLNLHSEREFEIGEAEDLINMQLLARGFTLLRRDEVLRVVPLKNIDITLVPYLDPQQLESSHPHQFVRVSFSLDWMIADDAAKEFLPLLSPYGTLFALSSANRLEAMDAVVNLREISRLVKRAETDEVRRERIAEFPLKYRKADEVAVKVRQLIGLPPDGTPSTSAQTQLDIEQARFKAEAVKQMGDSAKELLTDKKPTVFVSVNEKENSILVNAPPNKMDVIRQAIEALDKPLPEGTTPWETLSRVKVHEVSGFDPDTITKLLTSLQEQGNLSKNARIQYEATYNRLIVFASPDDQLTIAQVIESFRAQKRESVVVALANVDPIYAAKAIQLILKPVPPTASATTSPVGKFQAEADPDHQRLLLWATAEEVKEVREFLTRLGESFSPVDADAKVRIVNLQGTDLKAISPRLEELWRNVSDVPLIIEPNVAKEPTDKATTSEVPSSVPSTVDSNSSHISDPNTVLKTNNTPTSLISARIAELSSTDNDSPSKDSNQSDVPPLRIIEGENGEAIILSRDPRVVESARLLLSQLTKSENNIRAISLKHSQANSVKLQLDAMLQTATTATVAKLSSAKTLKIDADSRTNRLLIQNASASQWDLINDLVPVLDQPTEGDQPMVRKVVTYRFKFRNATQVVDVVKDVFRDLLSINDRAFSSSTAINRTVGYNRNLAATASNPEYQGLLAVAVDKDSNILIISAPAYLADEVLDLVEAIDTPSDGNAVAIVPFPSNQSKTKPQSPSLLKILSEGGKR